MSQMFSSSIFREYDIRGIAEKELSAEFAECLGGAYAKFIEDRAPTLSGRPQTVSVGWDCRLTSEKYADYLTKGLRNSGLDVIALGVCPTPLTYFSIFHLNLDGGIMVTGSHNPAEYNGFKICAGKDTLHGLQIQELRRILEQSSVTLSTEPSKLKRSPGSLTRFEVIPPYIDYLLKNSKKSFRKTPLKVVLDAGNGTASTVAPQLFKKLGAEVTPLFCDLDGRFPNHHPDPTVLKNLQSLISEVKKQNADVGIAFDGDSDRIGVVDETGRVLYGDELLVLFSRWVLKERPGATIISEVKSSHRLFQDIAKNGGQPLMWKTGHSLIKSKMKETKAALAGEMSGHVFFADRYFGYDDAIYAAMRLFEILAESNEKLSTLLSDLPQTVSTPEIRIDCQEDKKFQLVEEAKKILSSKRKNLTDIDGVRVDYGFGWGLIRASNTQPVLVLRFEATDSKGLEEIRNEMQAALQAAAKAVGHPNIEF